MIKNMNRNINDVKNNLEDLRKEMYGRWINVNNTISMNKQYISSNLEANNYIRKTHNLPTAKQGRLILSANLDKYMDTDNYSRLAEANDEQKKDTVEYTPELEALDPYNESDDIDLDELLGKTKKAKNKNEFTKTVDLEDPELMTELLFTKEDELIFTDKDTGLEFRLPNQKMVTVYINKENSNVELFQTPKKLGMLKLKKNMSFNKGDMNDLIKEIIETEDLDKNKVKKAFKITEERLLLRPEPRAVQVNFETVLKEKPDDKRALIELGQEMKDEYNIIRSKDDKYYYMDEYYKPMDNGIYQELIEKRFHIFLSMPEVIRSMKSISGTQTVEHNIWVMADNQYFNPITRTFTNDPVLTDRAFQLTNNNLAEYNPKVKFFNKEPTIMEKTLREILIPKNDPNDTTLYWNFLKLLSKSLVIGNKTKSINIFYNEDGNNGKSLLTKIHDIVFNNGSVTMRPKDLKDQFFYSRVQNTNTIIFDEIQPNSFNNVEDELKNLSGNVRNDAREMYSTERGKSQGYGTVFIYTNDLPKFQTNNTALINRLNIYRLPNIFVNKEPKLLGANEYLEDENLDELLLNDTAGQEWLFNVLIKLNIEKYVFNKQPNEETIAIIIKEDKVKKFIKENFKIIPFGLTDGLSNQEILQILQSNNIKINSSEIGQKRIIGQILNEVFGDELKRNRHSNSTRYNITRR